jgi:cyclohexanone monooxygenase
MINPNANEIAADWVRERIREIVKDPATAELLCPTQVLGCKRMCVDTGYFETFNQPHVHLVDIRPGGIEAITPRGVKAAGREFEVDAIGCASTCAAATACRCATRGRRARAPTSA